MQPGQLRDFLIELFPAFRARWDDEDNNVNRNGDDFTAHGVCTEFSAFFMEHASAADAGRRRRLFEKIEQLIAGDPGDRDPAANALCTCFLESIAGTPAGEDCIAFMGPATRKFFSHWHLVLPANAALLIVDVQKAIDHPSWGRRNNPHAESHIGRLLDVWRRKRRPVIHVRHLSREPESTYRPGQEGCEFKHVVTPLPEETVVTKHTNSAFIGTDLDSLLRGRDISCLVICGVITNNSVEATARMAGNLGYETYVVADATATFDKKDFDGQMRSAEDVHAMSLANLHGEYATVVWTSQLLD